MKERKHSAPSYKEMPAETDPPPPAEGSQEIPEPEGADKAAETCEDRIAELEAENADLKDQYLRKVADFDNYRKRMIREKQEAFDYANTSLLADLLDSLDNFDRALQAGSSDTAALVEGLEMTKKQLVSMLESKYSLTGYGEVGDVFDPNLHEAIGSTQGSVAEPICTEVYLKGYRLKDRVIRHAKVMVTMPGGSEQSGDEASLESSSSEADANQ